MSEISHVRDHLFLCFWFWCVVSSGLFTGFNIFMNRYSYAEDHGISMHTDAQAAYEEKDPITSISMRNGSLLMVSAKQKKGKGRGQKPRWCLLVYQPPNSMVVMGGRFQSQFTHAVPSFDDMKMLVQRETGHQCTWQDEHGQPIYVLWAQRSKLRMKEELQRLATVDLRAEENFRWNLTLRWCRNHFAQCPVFYKQNKKKELCRGRWRTIPEANAGCRRPAWDALQAADSFAAYKATTQSKATFDQTCAANAARVQNAEAKVTEASIATTEHSTAVVRDQLGLGSADAVGDQHGQGAASAVGDQQDSTSGVASLFVFLQSVFANLLPESLQKGDRLFTGDSMTRLLV